MTTETRGLYFEEFSLGQKIKTPSRTITETDVVNFAGLSGDYNALHTDAVFAQATPYGQRIAHGVLVLSIATGLAARHGFIEGTALAFRELSWKFNAPVFIGDTIYMEATVSALKPIARLGGGMVILSAVMFNQRHEAVQKGEWRVLMKSKPAAE